MSQAPGAGGRSIRLAVLGLATAIIVGLGLFGGAVLGGLAGGARTADEASRAAPQSSASMTPESEAVASRTPSEGPVSPAASPGPSTAPSAPVPTPRPTPALVAAPLTGLLVSPEAASRHPIAVMIDDHRDARPQSGFNSASIVWQAPAEGGIPRYMLVFQDQAPGPVGPVRSSREYFIEWAAEWDAVYVHAGGSPQALATLAAHGAGGWVWNGEYFRWDGRYLWRVDFRAAPHNVYSDGSHLRALGGTIGARDETLAPAWTFGPDARPEDRRVGSTLEVAYPYESITYRYDAISNTYRRYIDGSKKPQLDAGDGRQVGPKNVVILQMAFGPLNDGHPQKHRLEAQDVGHGVAYIATNGLTIKGTWRKKSATAPTLLFGSDGRPVRLTAGQTFVEVLPPGDPITLHAGHLDVRPTTL